MADQAVVGLPGQNRLREFLVWCLLFQRVKHGPQLRVDRRNFQHIARLAETDVDIIIELNGPRRA